MFKPLNIWEFKPFTYANDWQIKPIDGVKYGDWKPYDRRIVATFNVTKVAFIQFEFIEARVLRRECSDNVWEQILNDHRLLSISFYPEIYSNNWIMLMALADNQLRGMAAETAVNNLFTHFLRDNFDISKKMLMGRHSQNSNPMPVFFPEFWEWWQSLKQKELSSC
jgi:hypothetical protein